MPRIMSLSVTPSTLACGDRIVVSAQVAFQGPPRDVTLICEIGPSCHFSTGARKVSMRRFGPSPQSFRFIEQVRCPSSAIAHQEQIQVIATDLFEAADQQSQHITVQC